LRTSIPRSGMRRWSAPCSCRNGRLTKPWRLAAASKLVFAEMLRTCSNCRRKYGPRRGHFPADGEQGNKNDQVADEGLLSAQARKPRQIRQRRQANSKTDSPGGTAFSPSALLRRRPISMNLGEPREAPEPKPEMPSQRNPVIGGFQAFGGSGDAPILHN